MNNNDAYGIRVRLSPFGAWLWIAGKSLQTTPLIRKASTWSKNSACALAEEIAKVTLDCEVVNVSEEFRKATTK